MIHALSHAKLLPSDCWPVACALDFAAINAPDMIIFHVKRPWSSSPRAGGGEPMVNNPLTKPAHIKLAAANVANSVVVITRNLLDLVEMAVNMRTLFAVCVLAVVVVRPSDAHSYSLGSCPNVEPQADFSMNQMLGVWYAVQKTSTASSCITYNFTKTSEPYTYELEQVSQHFVLGLTPLKHEYHYTGQLTVPTEAVPARMKVRFPLSVAGSASYTVFMTDYTHYAAIFTCQKLAFAHRQSVTILSRERTLDKIFLDKIRNRLTSNNVDPFDLSIINQRDCPRYNGTGVNINIDDETFSPQSVGNVVRKAGEKIGDGVEFVAGGVRKIYRKYSDDAESGEAAYVSPDKIKPARGRYVTPDPQSEWLP